MKKIHIFFCFIFYAFMLISCGVTNVGEDDNEAEQQDLGMNNDVKEDEQLSWAWENDIDYLEKAHPKYFQDVTEAKEVWGNAKEHYIYVNNYSWNQYSKAKIIIESTGGTYSIAEINYINHIQILLEHFNLENEQYTVDAALGWIQSYTDMDVLKNNYIFKDAFHLKNDCWESEYYEMRYIANNDDAIEKYGKLFCVQIITDHNGSVRSICLEHSELNKGWESEDCYDWDGQL